jgi:hypothetical protein
MRKFLFSRLLPGLIFIFFFHDVKSQTPVKKVDLCIYGGTSAGVIAAFTAKKLGKTVLLIENSKHLGGMTSGGLSATDIGNKYAITGLSRDFFRRLGRHYGKFEHWLPEPKVAEKIFNDYIREAGAEVVYQKRLAYVFKLGNRIEKIVLEDVVNPKAEKLVVEARQFMDCTYEGDLMAQAGVSYFVGREDNKLYNETLSGVQKQDRHQFEDGIDPFVVKGDSTSGLLWGITNQPLLPNGTGDKKVQAYNFRMCITYDSLNRMPFPKPDNYDPSRYELLIRLIQSRSERGWKHILKSYFLINEIPNKKADWNNMGAFSTDFIGGNWTYPEANYAERARIWKAHEDYQKGLLYFFQTDPRIPAELQKEFRKWGLPKDEFQENGGWPYQLYVREARRMVGEYVMTEHNCRGTVAVADGIGMAAYTMDSHNCDRHFMNGMVKNEGNVEVGGFPPYDISFRSIVPKREECSNLTVPVCMSATHIAYGSIRMEPVFMVLAQTSAIAACWAIEQNNPVQMVDVPKLQKFLKDNPLVDGSTPEILVDDAITPKQIAYTGAWKVGEGNISKYGRTLRLAENQKGNSARLFPEIKKEGMYRVYYYFPRFWGEKRNVDSIAISISDGKKTWKKMIKTNEEAFHSNDNKGTWLDLGSYAFSSKKQAWLEVSATGEGKNPGIFIPLDAALWVPEK